MKTELMGNLSKGKTTPYLKIRDDEIVNQWIKEGWGVLNWMDFLSKKDSGRKKNIFLSRRQLDEFLKRNPWRERTEFSHKNVQYALNKDLQEISEYYAGLTHTVDLLGKRVDTLLDVKDKSKRKLGMQTLLVDLSRNLIVNVKFYCFSVKDRGLDIAGMFLAEYVKEIGLLLRKIKRVDEKFLEDSFNEFEEMFEELDEARRPTSAS